MSAKRVFFVNRFFHPDHSATSQILSDLAFHLAKKDFQISVIASRGLYDDPTVELPAVETKEGVVVHRVYMPRFGRASLIGRAFDYLAMYWSFGRAIWRLTNRDDVVVVKTDPPLMSVVCAPIAKLKALAQINWLQDLYPELALGLGMRALAPVAPLMIAARNASLRIARQNVVIGAQMRRKLEASGVAPERIVTIANWCDDGRIQPLPIHESALRSEWGLADKFVVGYSGNLGRPHEYETLIEAAEILRDEPDLVFLFIGGGHLIQPLREEAGRRNLSAMFRFWPYQPADALPQSLAVPDVHWISLLPAMEGLIVPSKFYGVAAAGRPIIAVIAPNGEIAELITKAGCGIAVTPGDGRSLAAAIRALKVDADLRDEMGHKARALLDDFFRREIALSQWEATLENLS